MMGRRKPSIVPSTKHLKDKKAHVIMMREMTHQEKTTILEVYEPKREYDYVKQELTDVQEEWEIRSQGC